MSSFAADLLVLWVVATTAGATLLVLVVAVQSAVTRARHRVPLGERHGPGRRDGAAGARPAVHEQPHGETDEVARPDPSGRGVRTRR